MIPVTPPPVPALTDAMAILRLIQDPSQASQLINDLQSATLEFNDKIKQINDKERVYFTQLETLKANEDKFVEAQASLQKDRDTAELQLQVLEDSKQAYTQMLADYDLTKQADLVKAQAYTKQQAERELRLNLQELDLRNREQTLQNSTSEFNAKLDKFKGLIS